MRLSSRLPAAFVGNLTAFIPADKPLSSQFLIAPASWSHHPNWSVQNIRSPDVAAEAFRSAFKNAARIGTGAVLEENVEWVYLLVRQSPRTWCVFFNVYPHGHCGLLLSDPNRTTRLSFCRPEREIVVTITKADLDSANYVFADESGKFQDKDFICLCGFLSSGAKWDSFTARWHGLLRKFGLPAVHMKAFYSDCAKLGMNEIQATRALEEFIDIIRDTISVGFAVGLDASYYRGMPDPAKEGMGDPGVACLQRLLHLIRDRFRNLGYKERISLTLDEDETYAMKFYSAIGRLRRKDHELGSLIGAVSFADDTFILPLQAADILANLTTRWFRDRATAAAQEGAPQPLLQRLLMSPERGYGLEYRTELWNGDALRKHLSHFVKWSGFHL